MAKNIKKYEFKAGLPQEFEIVDLATLYQESNGRLAQTHRTGFYNIIWFQKGSSEHLVDFNAIKINPNTLLFLNKSVVQRFDNSVKFEGIAILFTDSFFCKTESDTKFLRNSILFNDLFSISQINIPQQSKLLAEYIEQMMNELQNYKDIYQDDILQNLLHNFLLYAEREIRKQSTTDIKKSADLDYVILFKEILELNFTNQKKVGYYAKQIIITEKRLNQATSRILGKSPKEIIDDRVLLEAKRILAHDTESIKEISYYLGFEEPTNFIKYFKKHTALTPVEFRKKTFNGVEVS